MLRSAGNPHEQPPRRKGGGFGALSIYGARGLCRASWPRRASGWCDLLERVITADHRTIPRSRNFVRGRHGGGRTTGATGRDPAARNPPGHSPRHTGGVRRVTPGEAGSNTRQCVDGYPEVKRRVRAGERGPVRRGKAAPRGRARGGYRGTYAMAVAPGVRGRARGWGPATPMSRHVTARPTPFACLVGLLARSDASDVRVPGSDFPSRSKRVSRRAVFPSRNVSRRAVFPARPARPVGSPRRVAPPARLARAACLTGPTRLPRRLVRRPLPGHPAPGGRLPAAARRPPFPPRPRAPGSPNAR
jgi:hypothetical protein